MEGLQVVVAIGVAAVVGAVVAGRWRVTAPVALVVLGLLLTGLPTLRHVGLPSEVVLVLFLPLLLFWESLTTSSREIRRNLRGVVLSGTVFVVATAAVVAVVAHALGQSWETSWFIGAAVAPTDATAVSSIDRLLPRRSLTVLRAESLINDGTALVVFALVVEHAGGHSTIDLALVTWLMFRSYAVGVIVGVIAGWAAFLIRKRLVDPLLNTIVLIVTPLATYLTAEELGASGVLAVVACGLMFAQMAPRVISAETRHHSAPFWAVTTLVLNSALFVLIGLELPAATTGVADSSMTRALILAASAYVVVVGARFALLNLSVFTIRLLDRRPQQLERRTTLRERLVSTFAGFRGGVSLAVALAVPVTVGAGTDRDLVVFVTAVVVVASLVVQGTLLPRLVRWAGIEPDESAILDEITLAERTSTRAVLDSLDDPDMGGRFDDEVVAEVRRELEEDLRQWTTPDPDDESARQRRQYVDLKLAVLAHKRSTVVFLRDKQLIDDIVLRELQSRLDLEEVRLNRAAG